MLTQVSSSRACDLLYEFYWLLACTLLSVSLQPLLAPLFTGKNWDETRGISIFDLLQFIVNEVGDNISSLQLNIVLQRSTYQFSSINGYW